MGTDPARKGVMSIPHFARIHHRYLDDNYKRIFANYVILYSLNFLELHLPMYVPDQVYICTSIKYIIKRIQQSAKKGKQCVYFQNNLILCFISKSFFFLFRNQEFRHQTFLENREFLCSLQFLSKLFRAYCQTDNCGSV